MFWYEYESTIEDLIKKTDVTGSADLRSVSNRSSSGNVAKKSSILVLM